MIRRVRMARKRLMVAREREEKAVAKWEPARDAYIALQGDEPEEEGYAVMLQMHKKTAKDIFAAKHLRAIERRKDRIA